MFNIPSGSNLSDLSISQLKQYVAPNALPELSKNESPSSRTYIQKVMRYLRNSALTVLHKIEHKIISIFSTGAWISSDSVMRRLEVQVTKLSQELMKKANKGKVSFADTDRIREEVMQMKAICQKLQESGFDEDNITKLSTGFDIILDAAEKADMATNERKLKQHEEDYKKKRKAQTELPSPQPSPIKQPSVHSSHGTPKSPVRSTHGSPVYSPFKGGKMPDIDSILSSPTPHSSPSVRTRTSTRPQEDEDEQFYSTHSTSPKSPSRHSVHIADDDIYEDAIDSTSPLVVPKTEPELLKDLSSKIGALFDIAGSMNLVRPDRNIRQAFLEMDAQMALDKADRVLWILEDILINRKGMASWEAEEGGTVIFNEGHDDIKIAYYDLIDAYENLKDHLDRSAAQ